MLLSLDVLRGVLGVACKAYRRFVPARTGEVSRLEWCCGCVTCAEHRRAPLHTVHPPLGGSSGFFV